MSETDRQDRLKARVAELDRMVFEYRALLMAGEALHNELDVDRLCDLLIAIVCERLPNAKVAVLLVDTDENRAQVRRIEGLGEEVLEAAFPVDDGILRRMLLDGEPFSVIDVAGTPRFGDIWSRHGLEVLEASLWAPMVTKGALVGLISVGGLPEPEDESDSDQERRGEFLRHLASQAAVAFGTASLYARTQSARHDLDQSLHKLSLLFDVTRALSAVSDLTQLLQLILDRAIAGVNAQRGSLMLLGDIEDELVLRVVRGLPDPRQEELINKGAHDCQRLKRGEGIAGQVLRDGHTIRLTHVDESSGFAYREGSTVESIICVPLRADEGVIGVLNVTNKCGGADFTEQDEEILEALANQAAVAITRTRLYEAAITDSLTQLYIRRFVIHRLKEEVRRSVRYGQPLSLVMCDLDHFKHINDRYGHPAGDVVLAEVASTIRAGLRENVDLPGRVGGEEFVLVLPTTELIAAEIVAERLRAEIESIRWEFTPLPTIPGGPHEPETARVSMSFGVASFDPTVNETADALVARADRALFRAKGNGRNRVEIAPPPMGVRLSADAEPAEPLGEEDRSPTVPIFPTYKP